MKTMKKLITIPDDIRWVLEAVALKEKKKLKIFIEDLLIEIANKEKNDNIKN